MGYEKPLNRLRLNLNKLQTISMTSISLHYKKNTTGEQFGPPSAFSIDIFRWDGQRATPEEEIEAFQQYSRDHVARFTKRIPTDGYGDAACKPGGYNIYIERSDGLPLSLDDIGVLVLTNRMAAGQEEGECGDLDTVECINSPRQVQGVVAALDPVGVKAWFEAVQQLEPAKEPQVVTIADRNGAMLLLDAGLIERFEGSEKNQYAVPRTVAYCTLEFNP